MFPDPNEEGLTQIYKYESVSNASKADNRHLTQAYMDVIIHSILHIGKCPKGPLAAPKSRISAALPDFPLK